MTRHVLISVACMLSFLLLQLVSTPAIGNEAPPQASVHGKYSNLIQTMTCPKDRRTYGEYREYGYWGGGAWCGQSGKAGYWVWVAPKWYVWGNVGSSAPVAAPTSPVPTLASADGKYSNLIQTLPCPKDRRTYGEFRDYGYWGGGSWCGRTGKAGYWVWVAPNWYVWSYSN